MAKEGGHRRTRRATKRTSHALVAAALGVVAAFSPTQDAFAAKSKTFVTGDATAISQAVQIAPRTGGLSAAISIGTTIAQYRATLAQASSQAINLGIVGTTLTVQCDATPPALKPNQLPQPLVAESTHGNAHATKNTAGQGSAGVVAVAGHEDVSVKTQPAADAVFDGSALSLPGLIDADGLHSEGVSRLVPGKARIASATSKVGELELLGGAVTLTGMTWTAVQRTGTHPSNHGSFSIGGISLAGKALPISTSQLPTTIATINKLLASTGLHITLPTSHTQDGTLTESPLVIGLDSSTLGGEIVNPVLGALLPVTNPIRSALTGINCKIGSGLSLVDLATAALDGTGGLDIDLGGASANTDGKAYSDPFGHGHLGGGHTITGDQGPGPTSTPSTTSDGDDTGVSTPTTGDETLPPGDSSTTGSDGGAEQPEVSGTRVVSSSCSTLSPAHRPSCSQGQGLTIGLLAIALVGGVAGADYLAMRRKRRLPQVKL